jgi:carbonic anhydrase/acetyltransferase-like protein (isoleucine patch superfamily)
MDHIRAYKDFKPNIHDNAFVDQSSVVIGDVHIGDGASIWPLCVLRGDQGRIVIGDNSNIQDGSVVHATGGISTVKIGTHVTVGHKVILHGCTIEDWVLVGMGSIILDNSVIGSGSIIGAGALVTSNTIIPPNSMVLGSPAKVVRELRPGEFEKWIVHGAEEYSRLSKWYKKDASMKTSNK